MIDYVYKAKSLETGEIITANVKAESPEAAAKLLSKQKLFPIEVTAKSDSDILAKLGIHLGVGAKERVLFTRQLATLINAGLPLARALHTVQDQIKNQRLKDILGDVVTKVEGGTTLSAAFANHPKVFNQVYVSMVAAGESSGSLDKALVRLAEQQEKDAAVVSKIRSALVYPVIVLFIILGVIIMMLTTVVPQVAKLYADLKKELPLLTQIFMGLANFIINYWWLTLLILIALIFGLKAAMKTPKVKIWVDVAKLRSPVIGPIIHKMYMARFARTMSSLLGSGIHVLDALATSRGAITNQLVSKDIDKAIQEVRGGKALSESLAEGHHIMDLVPQMVKIGEESGTIDEMIGRAATYYENEVDEAVKNLSTTLEPTMMVVLGAMVALILGAVLYPVYSLVGSGGLQ